MLVRLIYVSYASTAMSDEDVKKILEVSQINNRNKKITGLLMYSSRYFFQCLEGERIDVNKTYLHIAADSRHSKCVLIDYSQVNSRLFPKWAMDYVAFNGVNNELLMKYSESGLFQPYDFTAGQAISLLSDIAAMMAKKNIDDEIPKSLLAWLNN